jgi:phosphoenolpyruvate carboxykinase (GTP)
MRVPHSYNMGDYFQHWLDMGAKLGSKAPKIFYVNWFRKDENGKFMWPGFAENSRVLKWMIQRVEGKVQARESPMGYLPFVKDIDVYVISLAEIVLFLSVN